MDPACSFRSLLDLCTLPFRAPKAKLAKGTRIGFQGQCDADGRNPGGQNLSEMGKCFPARSGPHSGTAQQCFSCVRHIFPRPLLIPGAARCSFGYPLQIDRDHVLFFCADGRNPGRADRHEQMFFIPVNVFFLACGRTDSQPGVSHQTMD